MNGASDACGHGLYVNLGRVNLAAVEPVRLPRMVPVRQKFESKRIDPWISMASSVISSSRKTSAEKLRPACGLR